MLEDFGFLLSFEFFFIFKKKGNEKIFVVCCFDGLDYVVVCLIIYNYGKDKRVLVWEWFFYLLL